MTAPFGRAQVAALKQLSALWLGRPLVLIGATAIKCHLATPRGTVDLDLTLGVSLDDYPAGLEGVDGWARRAGRPHERIGPGGVLVDVIPAGERHLRAGFLEWPGMRRMNLAGMGHAFTRNHVQSIDADLEIRVADLPVLALLKVVAYLDRPTERERDLEDLAHVIEWYGEDDERRWSDEVVDLQLEYESVGAYLLGRDLAEFVTALERTCLENFISMARDDAVGTGSRLCRVGPVRWRSDAVMLGRIAALERGLAAP
jgi:predicted nucleotidyltransferase